MFISSARLAQLTEESNGHRLAIQALERSLRNAGNDLHEAREEIVTELNAQAEVIRGLREDMAALVAAIGGRFIEVPAKPAERRLQMPFPAVNLTH